MADSVGRGEVRDEISMSSMGGVTEEERGEMWERKGKNVGKEEKQERMWR